MWTYRVKYSKRGRIRFISHLDVMRAITRALVRADIPVAYSKGFNPRLKISMGPALPLGYESHCELADITLGRTLQPRLFHQRLRDAMPEGLDVLEAGRVLPSFPPLSQASSACYVIELDKGDVLETAGSLAREFLRKDSVVVERARKDKKRSIDVRRFVKDVEVSPGADSRGLRLEIAIGGQGGCSAAEAARAILNLSPESAKCLRIVRTAIKFDGRSQQVNTNG